MGRILAHIGGLAGRERADGSVAELNERSREVFRRIVEAYVETGEPIGSRTISRRLNEALSPATIRNIMSDLQELGLLFSPHTSAGRLPTEAGLKMFVNGLLEVGDLSQDERASIEGRCAAVGRSVSEALEEATNMLAGLSHCASMVVAPKSERALRHIEFVALGPGRALVVLILDNGTVENRLIEVPLGLPPSALIEATNYLSARLVGRTMDDAKRLIDEEMRANKAALNELTQRLVELGLATWAPDAGSALIVRGQSRLLDDVTAIEDLENVRRLLQAMERGETFMKLLDQTHSAEGVQIFIGADNPLFGNAGCSAIVAPFANSQAKIVGAIGVVGPTRMNYARIIPLVDYTAKVVSRLVG